MAISRVMVHQANQKSGNDKMPSNADYMNALFQAAQTHGGVQSQGLTQDSIKKTEDEIKSNDKIQALIKEADTRKLISKDDPLFNTLLTLFLSQAKTTEGKERALRLVIVTTQKLNGEFTFQKKS